LIAPLPQPRPRSGPTHALVQNEPMPCSCALLCGRRGVHKGETGARVTAVQDSSRTLDGGAALDSTGPGAASTRHYGQIVVHMQKRVAALHAAGQAGKQAAAPQQEGRPQLAPPGAHKQQQQQQQQAVRHRAQDVPQGAAVCVRHTPPQASKGWIITTHLCSSFTQLLMRWRPPRKGATPHARQPPRDLQRSIKEARSHGAQGRARRQSTLASTTAARRQVQGAARCGPLSRTGRAAAPQRRRWPRPAGRPG